MTKGSTTERSTTVVVVTWNSAHDITGCLDAIPAGMDGAGAWDVVVVDNASSDDTVELARRHPVGATVISTGRNAGYAAGVNAGIATRPHSDGYLVLNPDVRVRPGCGPALWRAAADLTVGIVAPRLEDTAGRLQWSLRREPAIGRALGEALLGGLRAGRFDALGEVVTVARAYEHAHDVDWATGAAWLVTAACAARVGAWDESFFLYSEETDYALRARDAGLRTRFTPQAQAVHAGGDAHVSSALYVTLIRNRVLLYGRRHGQGRSVSFWCCLVLNEILRSRSPVHRAAARALVAGAPALWAGRRPVL